MKPGDAVYVIDGYEVKDATFCNRSSILTPRGCFIVKPIGVSGLWCPREENVYELETLAWCAIRDRLDTEIAMMTSQRIKCHNKAMETLPS